MVGDAGRGVGAELAAQVLLADPGAQLEGVRGVVAYDQVEVGVDDRAADAPGEHAAVVGEGVEAVLGALHDGERGVQEHPVQQVGQLTDPATDARGRLAVGQAHALHVALAGGAVADHLVEAEGLTGPDHDPVRLCGRETQIGDLVVLQPHLRVAELAQQERAVLLDPHRQVLLRAGVRPGGGGDQPVEVAPFAVDEAGEGKQRGVTLAQRRTPGSDREHVVLGRAGSGCGDRHDW